jgi:nitrate/nitrite-specific signal transduction histidine kinase
MNNELASQINQYLFDETKLYQDWYTSLTQTEDSQYTKQVGVVPKLSELQKLCEGWINQQTPVLKAKVCEQYHQKLQQFNEQEEALLIAALADILTIIFAGMPVNCVAVAVILVTKNYLKRICDFEL